MEHKTYSKFKEEYDNLLKEFRNAVQRSITYDSQTSAQVLYRGQVWDCNLVYISTPNLTETTLVDVRILWQDRVVRVAASRVTVVGEPLHKYVLSI